jgi:predicted amidophosphoribosyltransferase
MESGTRNSTPLESDADVYGRRRGFAESKLSSVFRAAADFLFPSRCLGCRARPVERFFRGGVCDACWEALERPGSPRCGACDEPLAASGVPAPGGGLARCGRCVLAAPPYRSLRGAAPYRGVAREVLIAFKFGGGDILAPHLARVVIDRLCRPAGAEEVVPVPATASARRRADHAAELLAAEIAARLRLPFAARRLEKIRATQRQSGLPLEDRAGNVRGAFRARPGAPAHVLLVDDVVTSGATARECARQLRRAGARTVDVWCFARASRDDLLMRDLAP